MQTSFTPLSWLHDCDWRRWGVAFAVAVISARCLLGRRSGNASLLGCCRCSGTLLRTGQLALRLTRRLWRTPLWHRWLTGSLFLDLWNLILPFIAVLAPLRDPACPGLSTRLDWDAQMDHRQEKSLPLPLTSPELRVMLLFLSLCIMRWHLTERQTEEAYCEDLTETEKLCIYLHTSTYIFSFPQLVKTDKVLVWCSDYISSLIFLVPFIHRCK